MFTSVSTRSASAYKKVSVETSVDQADPHHLVDMLFDGLLHAIGAARAALKRGDIKVKCQNIVTSVRILEEGLKGGLNLKEGGELAANLQGLYGYCVLRLTQANVHNDDAAMEEVIKVISPIAQGWKQISGAKGASVLPM
ncbi:flagellar export chaperone FliS [Rhodoferax ferrireducens]|uniref:flagellar export chaperone FliS n=1 Tax=Rhodoferax ferrireducens TaxID=192843 RepID=UPI000E0D95CA|nr:flagellar export chaperone FliS [Rhodoferax ferrireducens]